MESAHCRAVAMQRLGIACEDLESYEDDDDRMRDYRATLRERIVQEVENVQRSGISRAEFIVLGSPEYKSLVIDQSRSSELFDSKKRSTVDIWHKVQMSQRAREQLSESALERLSERMKLVEMHKEDIRRSTVEQIKKKQQMYEERVAYVRRVQQLQQQQREEHRRELIRSCYRERIVKPAFVEQKRHATVEDLDEEFYRQSVEMKLVQSERYNKVATRKRQVEEALREKGKLKDAEIEKARDRRATERSAQHEERVASVYRREQLFDSARLTMLSASLETAERRHEVLKSAAERIDKVNKATLTTASQRLQQHLDDMRTHEQHIQQRTAEQARILQERYYKSKFNYQRTLINKRYLERQNYYYLYIQYMRLYERQEEALKKKRRMVAPSSPPTSPPSSPQQSSAEAKQSGLLSEPQELKIRQMAKASQARQADLQRLVFSSGLGERMMYIEMLKREQKDLKNAVERVRALRQPGTQ